MKEFKLQISAAAIRKISWDTREEFSFLSDILPIIMAYAIHAKEDGAVAEGKNDEYYRKVSGLGVKKWKAGKAFLKKQGWVAYVPEKEKGRFVSWGVRVSPPFMSYFTLFGSVTAPLERPDEEEDSTTGSKNHPVEEPPSGRTTQWKNHPVKKDPPYNDKEDLSNDKENLFYDDEKVRIDSGLEKNPVRLDSLDVELDVDTTGRLDVDLDVELDAGRLDEPGKLDVGRIELEETPPGSAAPPLARPTTFTHPVQGWACEYDDTVIELYQYNYDFITTGKNRKILAKVAGDYSGSREEFIQTYLDYIYTADFKLHPKTNLERSLGIHLDAQLKGHTHARVVQEDTAKELARKVVTVCERYWKESYTHNGAGTRTIDQTRSREVAAVTKLLRRQATNQEKLYRLITAQAYFPGRWVDGFRDFDQSNGLMVKDWEEMFMEFEEWEQSLKQPEKHVKYRKILAAREKIASSLGINLTI